MSENKVLWHGYHNHMALKKTTVMVDENDLAVIKEAAAREGRPESEYFREAFHLAALRARRWPGEWDIPTLDFGHPVTADEIHQVVAEVAGDSPG
ncbi:ribbon-helix-helix domain-containing protein [Mycobacterium sp. pUA109]|uniref:ribbon-helix-helix domain-containing protein n=1 Tax=Mycobacterium sp. pUA109 TaxID=3238982 RepID=UPI00351B83B2